MKTSKRISALLLAVCLVMGMMVPVVSAETTTATETVTYDFDLMGLVKGKLGSATANGLSSSECISNIEVLHKGEGTTSKGLEVKESYLNWYHNSYDSALTTSPDFVSIGDTGNCEGYFRIRHNEVDKWVAFNIDNPGTGTWDISVTTPLSNRGAQAVNVYILPGTETDIVTATTHDDTGYNKYCIGNYNCYRALASGETDDKATPALSTITSDSVGTWVQNDDQASTFILVIKAATKNANNKYANGFLEELTMTKTSTDAEADLNDAILGSQITLNSNLALTGAVETEADIVVGVSATLDLNSQTLTADKVSCAAGAKVTDSGDGAGKLVIPQNTDAETYLTLQESNGDLPLYDTDGYRFFKTTVQSLGKTGAEQNKFWFRVSFTNSNAYALAASQMDIGAGLTADEITQVTEAWAGTTFTGTWVAAVNGGTASDICFTAKNFSTLTNFKLTPVVKANGVTVSGAAL